MSDNTETRTYFYVVPCGGKKLDVAAPAAELYVGQAFRIQLAAAEALVAEHRADGERAEVLILSAKWGLVRTTDVLDPYEQRMNTEGRVTPMMLTATAVANGITYGDEVYCFLPMGRTAPYFQAIVEACDPLCVWPQPVYEACGGNGDQRGVASQVLKGCAA